MTTSARRQERRPETITLGRLLDYPFKPREDLINPWLRQGESAMLWAPSGVGKTMVALTLAVMVAGGGSVIGWSSPKPRKVLLVDGEMNAMDLKERAEWLLGTVEGIDREAARENLLILSRNLQKANVVFPDLAKRDGHDGAMSDQDIYLALAKGHQTELAILDNFTTLCEVDGENEASAMQPVLAFLLRLKQERIGCILVHHSGKSGDTYRGSSALLTTFEVALGLKPLENTATTSGAAFKLEWTKYRREVCEAVRSREVRLVKDAEGHPKWVATPTEDDDVRRLLEVVRSCQHKSQRAIADALGWIAMKVSRLKGKAIEDGLITEKVWDAYMKGADDQLNPDF